MTPRNALQRATQADVARIAGVSQTTRTINLGSGLRWVLGPWSGRKTAGQTLASVHGNEPRCTSRNLVMARYGMPVGADSAG